MSPPKILRCAVYTRKSTEEGLEQAFNSLDAQREACEAYVMSQTHEGWVVLPTPYDDGGFSGGNMERPGLQALMRDIDRGLVDVIVVYKVDRLTRSLADFAKIVERFDKRGVSFVSVTQAFNTTSSMGRLTLNVLLSFAQFEREVTSERIRDKLAASRRKGMWMGGKAPFGYVVKEKKIYPDPVEAPIVQRIYSRYLDLKSVRLLRDELEAEGVISKAYVSRHGRAYGGKPFDRGALYHLLQNRIYIGEIQHKDEQHKGQHDGIVPKPLFDKVQAQLAEARRRDTGPASTSVRHPLAGLLWDSAGNRMSPSHGQKVGRRYRYYVSRAALGAPRSRPGAITRIPAEPIETLVLDRLRRLLGESHATEPASESVAPLVRTLVDRVTLDEAGIVITLHRDQLDIRLAASATSVGKRPSIESLQKRLLAGDHLTEEDRHMAITTTARPVRRGGATEIELPDGCDAGAEPRIDPVLLKAIARAHMWMNAMLSREAQTVKALAVRDRVEDSFISRILPLAFLAPADLARVLAGRQPPGFTVDTITRRDMPLMWPVALRHP